MKERSSIIIIEGPQGVGKSTLANYLRDNIPSCNLYRLSGIKDKTKEGYEKNKKMYNDLLEYMKKLEGIGINLIFDRTFFTEEVYCNLGYKEYKFNDVYEKLVKKLNDLDFDIYFVVLGIKDTTLYEKRLKRDHHEYQKFSISSSVLQQEEYIKIQDEIKEKNINKLLIYTDDYDQAYKEIIESIPILKENIKTYK